MATGGTWDKVLDGGGLSIDEHALICTPIRFELIQRNVPQNVFHSTMSHFVPKLLLSLAPILRAKHPPDIHLLSPFHLQTKLPQVISVLSHSTQYANCSLATGCTPSRLWLSITTVNIYFVPIWVSSIMNGIRDYHEW